MNNKGRISIILINKQKKHIVNGLITLNRKISKHLINMMMNKLYSIIHQ